jgi:hypothetical protein
MLRQASTPNPIGGRTRWRGSGSSSGKANRASGVPAAGGWNYEPSRMLGGAPLPPGEEMIASGDIPQHWGITASCSSTSWTDLVPPWCRQLPPQSEYAGVRSAIRRTPRGARLRARRASVASRRSGQEGGSHGRPETQPWSSHSGRPCEGAPGWTGPTRPSRVHHSLLGEPSWAGGQELGGLHRGLDVPGQAGG